MSENPFLRKKCAPCEGGVPAISADQARVFLKALPEWSLNGDGKAIRARYLMKDFMAAMDLMNAVARLAEEEGHHPDLHLVGYRDLSIELWTHAIGGLSENDFILAAKIDQLPKKLK
jgi:4a-hydroxytetrahydrobiopterin dehydratase